MTSYLKSMFQLSKWCRYDLATLAVGDEFPSTAHALEKALGGCAGNEALGDKLSAVLSINSEKHGTPNIINKHQQLNASMTQTNKQQITMVLDAVKRKRDAADRCREVDGIGTLKRMKPCAQS